MKFKLLALASLILAAVAAPASAAVNVAFGASVTPQGTFGVGAGGWGPGPLAPYATLTDGAFLPEGTQWNQNSIWWGSTTPYSSDNFLIVDLGAQKTFDRLVLQADNNDRYAVDYWSGSSWQRAWDVGAVDGWGMKTRDSGTFSALSSQYLRVYATGGDTYYSVSELQALAPIPEPETYGLIAAGLVITAVARRRKA